MKKLFIISILTYLFFTINTSGADQDLSKNNNNNKKILKIGVLLPLSGEFENIGHSFLRAIQLALYDIPNKNIKIYPKDNKSNSIDTYKAAKEFEELGIKMLGSIHLVKGRKRKAQTNLKIWSYNGRLRKKLRRR